MTSAYFVGPKYPATTNMERNDNFSGLLANDRNCVGPMNISTSVLLKSVQYSKVKTLQIVAGIVQERTTKVQLYLLADPGPDAALKHLWY